MSEGRGGDFETLVTFMSSRFLVHPSCLPPSLLPSIHAPGSGGLFALRTYFQFLFGLPTMCTRHSFLDLDFKPTKTLRSTYSIPKSASMHSESFIVYVKENILSDFDGLSFENQLVIRENAFGIIYVLFVVLGPAIKHITVFWNNCIQ